MVSATDLKIYKTTNNLGGAITGTQIQTGTPNNLFSNVPNNERVIGEDYYACIFLKNAHATEKMDNFKFWLSDKSLPNDTEIKWGYEPNVSPTTGYRWSPFRTLDGAGGGVVSVADSPELDVARFTVACWFRTTDINVPPEGEGFMVCKGGWLSNDPNKQLNYGLWHSDADHLRGGFETVDGIDHIVTSGTLINDGTWRHAVVTYDGTVVTLYMNGTVRGTHATTDTPATSTNPLLIGDNSFNPPHLYFTGDIDQVYIWDEALSSTDVGKLYTDNIVNPSHLVYSNTFGADDDSPIVAQTIADKYTAPNGVTWNGVESEPTNPNLGEFKAGATQPIWLWYHVNANAISRLDDNEIFDFNFDIPIGGTGTGGTPGTGGGSGGNPPPTPTNYKVAIVGDEGCSSATDSVVNLIKNNAYDYVVSVGDHAYEPCSTGSCCWVSKFNQFKSKMNSAYGNHEYSETGKLSPYKAFFGHSLTYFTFKFQNIQFFVYDTNISLSSGSTQYNAMKTALEQSQTDNTVVWRIAIMHHPWFGDNGDHTTNEFNQVQSLHKLFTDNGVNILCVGHNHNWERTHLVSYNSSNPRNPTIVDNTSPYTKGKVGLIGVNTGTGGHDKVGSLYHLTAGGSWRAYANNSHNGIWEIVATNSGNTLTCSFVEIGGDKFDTFVYNAS